MGKLRLCLIVILACCLGVVGYQRYQRYRSFQNGQQAELATLRAQQDYARRHPASAVRQFVDQATDAAIPTAYQRPVSAWTEKEQTFYEKVLVKGQYDTLVVPLQANGRATFDRATRSLMSAELTAAVASAQRGKVADQFLVEKVFGEGLRHYSDDEIYRIADLAGVRRLIWGGVGHDRHGHMQITIVSQTRPAGPVGAGNWTTPIVQHQFTPVGLDEDIPAFDSFAAQIPEILKSIGIEGAVISATSAASLPPIRELPRSPLGLLSDTDNPAVDAYTYLLFAELTPANMERDRERFVEKAVLAASRLVPTAAEYRALNARAFAMLGYRSAALHVLGSPSNDEDSEIQAMLAGNLPEVRRFAIQEQHPVKRLLAALDANRIAADYKLMSQTDALTAVKAMHLPGNVWPYLIARAFTDRDPWSQFDNGSLKQLLDKELPIPGSSMQDILRGAVSIGGPEKAQWVVDLSIVNHAEQYLTAHLANCCDPPRTHVKSTDYMDLLAAMGNDNLIRRIDFLANVQRSNREAIAYADRIRSVYQGFPYYEVVRAEAEIFAANDAGGAEREGMLKAAYESAFNAMYWEQSQSAISSRALTDVAAYFHIHEYGYFDNFYYTDLPFHPTYMLWGNGGDRHTYEQNGLAALGNSTSEIDAAVALVGPDRTKYVTKELAAKVTQQLQDRFAGSPDRATLLADQEIRLGNPGAAEGLLRENIRSSPTFRASYLALGDLLFSEGKPVEASRVFLSYPGLRGGAVENHVTVANAAADMAQDFYYAGDFAEATKFLGISASQGSGAGSELQSMMRMKLITGDIPGALVSALLRAQRYNDPRAFRDYLGMLHAMHHSSEAWAGFSTLVRELQAPQVWDTALVGHHIAGTSEDEVRQWVSQPEFQMAGNHTSYAINYLTRFATTDRIPSADLGTKIADMDRPTWQLDFGAHEVVRPDADGRDQQILGPAGAVSAEGVLRIGVFERGGPKHRVRPASAYFVDAYRELKLSHFSEARRIFAEASSLYDMASPSSSYMLPYYALSSARAGTGSEDVQGVLRRFPPEEQRFDYQLARAVLQAATGATSDVLESLLIARYRRPLDDERVLLTPYTYGDVCEELYRLTGSSAIRKVALDWAKSREVSEPWFSWSYALEAALTTDPTDRQWALALAFYLDPHSAHLAAFRKEEVEAAVREYAGRIPFQKADIGTKPGTST